MIKTALFLLVGTFLFSQTTNGMIIEQHTLEVGNWITESEVSKSDNLNESNVIPRNANLKSATEADIWKYFLSTKPQNTF